MGKSQGRIKHDWFFCPRTFYQICIEICEKKCPESRKKKCEEYQNETEKANQKGQPK